MQAPSAAPRSLRRPSQLARGAALSRGTRHLQEGLTRSTEGCPCPACSEA